MVGEIFIYADEVQRHNDSVAQKLRQRGLLEN